MREIRTSGSMSGEGKRDDAAGPQVTAPLLDSTAQQSEIVRRTKKGAPSHALGCIWECDLPNGSLHDPDGPEADGQKEYRGGNCKTDLFAHGSLLNTDWRLNWLAANSCDGHHAFAVF